MSADKTNAVVDPQKFLEPTTFAAPVIHSVTTGITAGTTQTQAGATKLVSNYNNVATCANANDGVQLPSAAAIGQTIQIRNSGAANLKIWPASGEKCNTGTTDAGDTTVLAAAATRTYICYAVGDWTIFSV